MASARFAAISPAHIFAGQHGVGADVKRAGRSNKHVRHRESMMHATPDRRTFLLTGVTGFLGKVLLEELVRRRDELCIDRIGVVIRPLRGLSAEERFRREVARSALFRQAAGVLDRAGDRDRRQCRKTG